MFSLAYISIGLLSAIMPLVTADGFSDILHRDVVVIGGGASGAYAAVRLRDDFNKSIALIEKQSILVCFFLKIIRFELFFKSQKMIELPSDAKVKPT